MVVVLLLLRVVLLLVLVLMLMLMLPVLALTVSCFEQRPCFESFRAAFKEHCEPAAHETAPLENLSFRYIRIPRCLYSMRVPEVIAAVDP